MKVKYLDLPAQFKENAEFRKAIDGILSSGQFILGSAVEEFERNFARFCSTRFAVGVSSGTDALFLALKVAGVGEGDEVITVPNSFVATVGAIVTAGAYPRLVDVGADYNIDPEEIKKAVNKKTKAIIPVHLTGNPARMDEINAIAAEHKLVVIEDAAQAAGASIGERKVGSLGDLAAFSLHPLKNLNTCGDGGVITTDRQEDYESLLLWRNHGLRSRDESQFFAYNSRLDSLKAAVADLQIKNVDEIVDQRNKNAAIYDRGLAGLAGSVTVPERSGGIRQVFHAYVVQVEKREELIDFLEEKGVETKIHYPIPIHLMEAAEKYGYRKGDFPVAEAQAEKIISLPVHHHLSEEQILYVIDCIGRFYGEKAT